MPTSMLQGADDRCDLPETSEGKERFFKKGYDRKVLPDIGHFVPREAPDEVVDAIRPLSRRRITMPHVLVRQKTRDPARWRAAFDSQHARRRAAGCRSELVLINEVDPSDMFALMEFEDPQALRADTYAASS